MRKISIDPITRLEGHGKIEIFLDDDGNVANSYLQVPGWIEKFAEEGWPRYASDYTESTVLPEAHHLASTKRSMLYFM